MVHVDSAWTILLNIINQPNIIFVVRDYVNATSFALKTNKYVGSRTDHPEQLQLVDRYDSLQQRFQYNHSLFPDKLRDLKGREVIIAYFDYRPYTVMKYVKKNIYGSLVASFKSSRNNIRNIGVPETSDQAYVYIDGTETRVVLNFCAQFNCTLQIDTSDANDWGTIYPNISGDGALGMIVNHKADISIGAMYSWYDDYTYLDLSMYLVRSGITCLVPAPKRLTSWYLPVQPFQTTLWAAVLLCLSIETIGLVLAHRSEQHLYLANRVENIWLRSLAFGLVTTFKLFISQAGNSNVRSVTVRVLLFACFLNDIIISSIYGGGLASILTIPSMGEAADTLERLRAYKLQWAANSEAWVSSIRSSDDLKVRELLENFHIYDDHELLVLAHKANMGFTVERLPFGNYLTGPDIEQMVIMQEDLYYQYTVAFVPRLWPLLERFNQLIYCWHSSGFDKYWEYRVVADNLNVQIQKQVENTIISRRQNDIGIEPVTLGMANFAGILLVWVLGALAAITVFALEFVAANLSGDLVPK
ncbi:Ir41a [Drosophila busckii]|uniref:Ir41a n=1 Tax=Drosophila busckii TaxID=30019 RepID=A0A0M4ET77_DROBS|nr:Ir41a [Drosophila busckii]